MSPNTLTLQLNGGPGLYVIKLSVSGDECLDEDLGESSSTTDHPFGFTSEPELIDPSSQAR